jgi:hypothetical protein
MKGTDMINLDAYKVCPYARDIAVNSLEMKIRDFMSQERNTERRMKIRNYIAKLRILRKAA